MPFTYDNLIAIGVPKNLLDSAIDQYVDLNLASIYKSLRLTPSDFAPGATIQSDWQLLILGGYIFDESLLIDSFLSQKDNSDATPIHYAAWSGNPIAINGMFVKAEALGIKPIDLFNQKDAYGRTMAHYAARSGNPIAIEAMFVKAVELGIKPIDLFNQKDGNGETMAHYAALSGNPLAIETMFAKAVVLGINPIDLFNQKDGNGLTMAHYAALSGNPLAIETMFVKARELGIKSIDLFSQKDKYGRTMVHFAAWSGNPEAIEGMFAKAEALGINPIDLFNQKDSNGETMAHYAALSGNPLAIEAMFVKAEALGINPLDLFNQKNDDGSTMVHYAAQSSNPKAAFVAFINFYAKKLETDITITEIKWPDGVNEEDYPEIQAIQKRLDENKAIQAANTTLAGLAVTAGSIPEFNKRPGGSTTATLCRDVWKHITSFILPAEIFIERYDNNVMTFYVQHLHAIEKYLSIILTEANKPSILTSVTTNFFGTRNAKLALREPESTKNPINRQAHFENMQAVWRSRLEGLDLSSPHALLLGLQQQLNNHRLRYGDSKAYLIKVLPNITEKTTWGEARTALESGGKIPTGLKEAVDYINYRSILGTVNDSKVTPGDSSSPKKS